MIAWQQAVADASVSKYLPSNPFPHVQSDMHFSRSIHTRHILYPSPAHTKCCLLPVYWVYARSPIDTKNHE